MAIILQIILGIICGICCGYIIYLFWRSGEIGPNTRKEE